MASRFAQNKPDPAIKKKVRQSRARHQGGKYARAMVAGASVALTIMGWALFSTGEANMLAQTQEQDTQYVTIVAAQTQDTTNSLALVAAPTTTPATVSAITSTRSSR
jgi:hypothetical protein